MVGAGDNGAENGISDGIGHRRRIGRQIAVRLRAGRRRAACRRRRRIKAVRSPTDRLARAIQGAGMKCPHGHLPIAGGLIGGAAGIPPAAQLIFGGDAAGGITAGRHLAVPEVVGDDRLARIRLSRRAAQQQPESKQAAGKGQ